MTIAYTSRETRPVRQSLRLSRGSAEALPAMTLRRPRRNCRFMSEVLMLRRWGSRQSPP